MLDPRPDQCNVTGTLGINPAARTSWQALQQALLDLDRPTPCRADPDAWTDPRDPEAAEMAGSLCTGCPVSELCDSFANANHERAGIWAGRSRTPTLGRRPANQPSKETALCNVV